MTQPGNIILLNGTSSAGKSTIDLPLAAAEQRERQRGDRGPGNVRYFYPRVYELNDVYDVRINAESNDPEVCAQLIKTAVATVQPTAFKQLYQALH